MNSSSGDRNLLFGVLALQMGFITREALISAVAGCASDPEKPLDRILIERSPLAQDDLAVIEQAVGRLLEKHDNDARKCLAMFDPALLVRLRDRLQLLGAADVSDTIETLEACTLMDTHFDVEGTTAWLSADSNGAGAEAKSRRPAVSSARFRVIRLHAKGGLGEVYVARDEELDRNVALKEIRAEHAQSERLRARFVREAEINGNLEHPGIVPVYGLGAHPDGRPYYAMRFVEGETLKAAVERFHAEAAQLDPAQWTIGLRRLLRRFIDICDSIDYAHSRGVLHRDLKPANVLLGKFGETLIIDWGLAKIIGGPEPEGAGPADVEAVVRLSGDDSHPPTLIGETMGSPPFMSPEQARGDRDELTSATDIYSLGATLYTVLTGRPPVGGGKVVEIIDKVVRGDVEPPAKANPRVPRALDAICSKAMRLDPAERYPSARALADDLECWLDDRPVSVYRDPAFTRLLRWSRRHRSLVASTLALLLATLAGLALFAVVADAQKRRAVIAREQTEEARRRAKEHLGLGLDVVDQLVTIGDRQLITRMPTADRSRFLRAAANFIHRFREREPGDQSIQVQTAQVARRLANLHRLTGKLKDADRFYEEALFILENLTRQSSSRRYDDLLAETLIDQGDAWITQGRAKEAETVFLRARQIARKNVEAAPNDLDLKRTLARSLSRLGSAHLVLGRSDVVNFSDEALEIIEPIAAAALPTVRESVIKGRILPLTDQLELVQARYTLAEGLEQSGRLDEAEEQLRQALKLVTSLSDQFRGLPIAELDFFSAWVETRLARLPSQRAKGEESLRWLDDAVTRLESLAKRDSDIPQYQASLADALAARASIHEQAGSLAKAKADAEAAETAITPLLKGSGDVPDYSNLLAEALAMRGRLARREGADATELFENAIRHQRQALAACKENPAYAKRLEEYEALLKATGKRTGQESSQPR